MSSIFSPSQAAQRAPPFCDDDLEWLGVLGCLRHSGMPIAQMRRYATMAERLSLLKEDDRQVLERIALLQTPSAANDTAVRGSRD